MLINIFSEIIAMTYQTIVSAEVLTKNLDNTNWVILDCRDSLVDADFGHRSYLEAHIPNASFCFLFNDFSSAITPTTGRHPLPDMAKLSKRLGDLGIDENAQVVVYDDMGGAIAARMWWQIRTLGHKNVALLDGGLKYWLSQNYPMTAEIKEPEKKDFQGNFDSKQLIEVETVLENIKARNFGLLDARAAPRYRGEKEPFDPVAGHVPNAVNRDFMENLDEHGLFKSPKQLKIEFEAILEECPNQEIVHMCGSGVTANHNMLAMEIAGLTGSKLFLGSWSQWVTDPSRPVATH